MKPKLGLSPVNSMELQLICNCCGQPHNANKGWEDRLQAVFLGQNQFAICPLCTQAPSEEVFNSRVYRRRCIREVLRLQKLWEEDQKSKGKK